MDAPYVVITVAYPSVEEAQVMADYLVQKRLAACGQVSPIVSTYRWEGRVVTNAEHLLTLKTTAALMPSVAQAVREEHSFEVCEIVATPMAWVDDAYADWLDHSTRPG